MKKSIITILIAMLFILSNAYAGGGTYKGGKGKSHKGGKYKNSSTNNHYKKRK